MRQTRPELLKVPEIKLPDRHCLQDPTDAAPIASVLSLLNAEIRGLGALVEALGTRVEAIARETHRAVFSSSTNPFRFEEIGEIQAWADSRHRQIHQGNDTELQRRVVPLLRGASRQMELVETAILKGFSNSWRADRLLKLIESLRTWAEEGVICAHKPILTHLVNYIRLMRRECRETINGERKRFGRAAPTVPESFVTKEFDPLRITPGSTLLENVEAIYRELMINPNLCKPQKGFFLLVTAKELAEDLAKPGARLFIPYHNRQPIGFCLIFTDQRSFPTGARNAIASATGSVTFPDPIDGWGDMIGLSSESRKDLNKDYDPYRYLSECLMESARALGIQRLWSEVRVGAQANPAIASHLEVGWKPTGIEHVCNSHPYEVLLAHPFENSFAETNDVHTLGLEAALRSAWVTDLQKLTKLYRDFSCLDHDSATVPNFMGFTKEDKTRIQAEIENQLGCKVTLKFFVPNENRDNYEIRVIPERSRPSDWLAIRQKIPGRDLWKLEEWDYYLLGFAKQLQSFEQVLADFASLRER